MIDSKQVCILYMEDDAGLARLLQKNLEKQGYWVDIACDGQEGLVKFHSKSYDIVLIDQTMPILDGLEVISMLAYQKKLPPTIMLTGNGNEKIAVKAMKLGASDYIVKDLDLGYLELLPTVIKRVLSEQRLREEKIKAEQEKERLIKELQAALAKVKLLGGLLPICASCKKIRDDHGYWSQIESYISQHSEADFTHSICPDCYRKVCGEMEQEHDEETHPVRGDKH